MNVNFTVFIDKILRGEKRQTIRRASPKWANVKPGDKLTLYAGLRTKQCRKLGEARVWKIAKILMCPTDETILIPSDLGEYITITGDEVFRIALLDGFYSLNDFWSFFRVHYGDNALEMNIIRWCDFKVEDRK